MANARFLLRPRWLLSHVLVLLLVIVMVNLGFWQLRRLDEKRERNALIEARLEQPVVPVEDILAPAGEPDGVATARFRPVTATGTYDDDATVVVRNRSQDGVAGAWLVTPLVLASGDERVGVLRGFVSLADDGSPVAAPPPSGQVTVEGLVVDPGSFDGTAPGDLEPLLAEDDMLAGLVLAESSSPPEPSAADVGTAGPTSLLAVPTPELSEGPHLGYAAQWFVFSAIAVIGYPLVLRRVVARRGKEVDDAGGASPDDTDEPGDPDDLDAELEHLLQQGG